MSFNSCPADIELSTGLADFKCEIDEELSALTAFSPTINDKTMPFFCLGSFTYEAEEKEPTKGRLMIFTAYTSNPQNSSNLQLSLVAEAKVKGCVYSITIIDDMIVASVNSAVSFPVRLDSLISNSFGYR